MNKFYNRYLLFTLIVLLLAQNVAFAADGKAVSSMLGNEHILSGGTGMGTQFDVKLIEISKGVVGACQKVLLIMTAVAGMMIAWGMEEGKKVVWQIIFGFGLAVNFGSLLMDLGIWNFVNEAELAKQNFKPFTFEYAASLDNFDFLGKFLQHYQENIIVPGAIAILPYCLKLLVILCVIDATYEYATKSLSGDKLQYTIATVFKLGIYMYFLKNWIELMAALETGFEFIGFKAGGADSVNLVMQPNQIVNNALSIFSAQWDYLCKEFSVLEPGLFFVNLIALVVIFFLLIITAMQIFMAKVEFLTMALLTMPLLAFGTTQRFNFLCNKAIGAMFNLAIKVSCICFITTMSVPFIQSFTKQFEKGAHLNFGLIIQTLLGCLLLFLLTTKIPELVQGLLSGTPSLGGGGMIAMAVRGAHIAKSGGSGAVSGASSGAKIGGSFGGPVGAALGGALGAVAGGVKGSLMDLSKQVAGGGELGQTLRRISEDTKTSNSDIVGSSVNAAKTTGAAASGALKGAGEMASKGMEAGAKVGGAIGSVIPGVGNAVGSAIGGAIGGVAGTAAGAVKGGIEGASKQMAKNATEKAADKGAESQGGTSNGGSKQPGAKPEG